MRRAAAVVAASTVAVLLVASPAGALPILDPADAEELAIALADATDTQDICYGWEVTVQDENGSASGIDTGSNLGPTAPVDQATCDRYVVFTADLLYASDFGEAEDSARFGIRSNIDEAPTTEDLRDVGIDDGGLLGESDDAELADAVLALPALVAATGAVPFVESEPNNGSIPEADGPTGTPSGSDWLRQNGRSVAVGVVLILIGLGWALWSLFGSKLTPPSYGRGTLHGPVD